MITNAEGRPEAFTRYEAIGPRGKNKQKRQAYLIDIRMKEETFGRSLKSDLQSKKQRLMKGIAKKEMIRKNMRY